MAWPVGILRVRADLPPSTGAAWCLHDTATGYGAVCWYRITAVDGGRRVVRRYWYSAADVDPVGRPDRRHWRYLAQGYVSRPLRRGLTDPPAGGNAGSESL